MVIIKTCAITSLAFFLALLFEDDDKSINKKTKRIGTKIVLCFFNKLYGLILPTRASLDSSNLKSLSAF